MNHDEKNPNPDMQPWIEPELEARVVAWVMGEASPFEIAELERLLREKPELAIFKRQIEAVHGLVGEAARPDRVPLKMSAERRAKLLQTIGATETAVPAAHPVESPLVLPLTGSKRKRWHQQPWIWATAASVAVGMFVATQLAPVAEFKLVAGMRPDPATTSIPAATSMAPALEGREVAVQPIAIEGIALDRPSAIEAPTLAAQAVEPPVAYADAVRPVLPRPASETRMDNLAVRPPVLEVRTKQALEPLAEAMSFTPPPTSTSLAENRIGGQSASFGGGGGGAGRGGRGGGMGGRGASPAAPAASAKAYRQVALDGSAAAASGADRPSIANAVPALAEQAASPVAPPADSFAFAPPPPAARVGAAAAETTADLSFTGAADARFFFLQQSPSGTVAEGQRQAAAASGTNAFNESVVMGHSLNAPAPSRTSAPADTLALSPFTVSTDKDLGYMAGSTLSGGRLNSSLSDLASSVTVVTKEQFGNAAPSPLFRGFGSTGEEKKRDEREVDDALQRARRPAEPAPKVEETSTAKEPVSTFSLHVSDVSFRLAQAALARGEVPEPARIRPEEFYNAFDYGDPAPTLAEKVGARIEQSAHPVLQQRNLVRVAFKVPAAGRAASQPLRLTVLLDTSGSMEREDRAATVRRALEALGGLLGPQDRVTLIGFARQPRLLAENVSGNQSGMLVGLVANTPVEGGTNLEEALKLAGQLARRHQLAGAQNRIVLLTDGAANLGNANPAQFATVVETLRQQGIAFDACGVGLNGLDDGVLEALTRRGDGRYYVLDSPDAADSGFARQLAGAFRPAAENVKVQVRFNPARVAHYRLVGFDQHRLSEQDFRNDAVDAAELAAEEAAVALYEVEVLPQGSGEVGELFVRFRDPASGTMVERSWTIAYDAQARAFDRATPSLQLAGTSALLAEKLRQSPIAGQFKLSDLTPVVNALRGSYGYEPRVQELVAMFDQARRLGRD